MRSNKNGWIFIIGSLEIFTLGIIAILGFNNQTIVFSELGQIDTNGEAYDVQVVGNIAYVIDTTDDNPGGLLIIDISDPTKPKKLSSYYNGGLPTSVFVTEGIAYLPATTQGLEIINVSNPEKPVKIGGYDDGGYTKYVQVIGDLAYVADNSDGLEILNVSDPTHPTKLCEYRPSGTYFHDFCIKDNLMYATDHRVEYTGIRVLNISDPCNIYELGNYIPSGVDFIYPYVYNDYLFAADHNDDTGELRILDVHDPTNITQVSEFYDGGYAMEIIIEGDLAYITDFEEGLEVLDISNPSKPVEIGQYYDDSGHATDVFVVDNIAYVADRDDGLEILEISFETKYSSPGFELFCVIITLSVLLSLKSKV